MDIQNRKALRQSAFDALSANPGNPRLVALIYIAVFSISALAVEVLLTVLDSRIAQTGGLSNMGLRSILTTIQMVLPLAQTVLLWCVQLGYQNATVRMARRQPAQPDDLMEGFRRFGSLLRSILLRYGVYFLIFLGAFYVSTFIFMLTPLSTDFTNLVGPLLNDPDALYTAYSTDMEFFLEVGTALLPLVPILLGIFLLLAAPFFYQYRMVPYCLLENPRAGAMAALAESARMMKGHRVSLLKLDLGFWWFYLGQAVAALVICGNGVLTLLGIPLPWSDTVSFYVFYVLGLTLNGILLYFFMNRVETTYVMAYENLRPRQQPAQGAVLGNIFDLAKDYHE